MMGKVVNKERALRKRVAKLQDALQRLQREAGALFRTSAWIRTEEELPPVGLRVLGLDHVGHAWFERKEDGRWTHDYMNGHITEEPRHRGPRFWMVLPPDPEELP